jgi:uncharacterized protein (TIGR03000 family)
MYTAVLMLAMTSGAQTTEWCHGCYGGFGFYAGYGCYSCYGGYGGYAGYGCYGCYGGCYGGYYRDRYYGYNFSGYPWSVGYSLTDGPMVVQGPKTIVRDSFYPTPTATTAATVRVLVPNANAQVWFNDHATTTTGTERAFASPPLSGAGRYTVKATWTEDGRTVNQQRTVEVQPGQTVMVDFRAEPIPSPR